MEFYALIRQKTKMLMSTSTTDIEVLKRKVFQEEEDSHKARHITQSVDMSSFEEHSLVQEFCEISTSSSVSMSVKASISVDEDDIAALKQPPTKTKRGKLTKGMSFDSAAGMVDALQTRSTKVPLAKMDSTDSLIGSTPPSPDGKGGPHGSKKSSTTTFFRYSKQSLKHLLRQQSEWALKFAWISPSSFQLSASDSPTN